MTADKLSGAFHNALRTAGVQVTIEQNEKIRTACDQLVEEIQNVAEAKAKEICIRLQKAVLEGFDTLEDEVKDLKNKLENSEELRRAGFAYIETVSDRVEALKSEVAKHHMVFKGESFGDGGDDSFGGAT